MFTLRYLPDVALNVGVFVGAKTLLTLYAQNKMHNYGSLDQKTIEKAQQIAKEIGVTKKVTYVKVDNEGDAHTCDSPSLSVIALSADAGCFTIAHELAHVKNRDTLKITAAQFAIVTAATLVSKETRSNLALAALIAASSYAVYMVPKFLKIEEKADTAACQVCDVDSLARAIVNFDKGAQESVFSERIAKMSWFSAAIHKISLHLDPHPPHVDRIRCFKEHYYRKFQPFPIEIETPLGKKELSLEDSNRLRKLVAQSKKETRLIHFDRIVLNDNVLIHRRNIPGHCSYKIAQEKIDAFVSSGRFEDLESLLKDVIATPSYYSITAEIPQGATKEIFVETLHEQMPFIDWEKTSVREEDRTVFVDAVLTEN